MITVILHVMMAGSHLIGSVNSFSDARLIGDHDQEEAIGLESLKRLWNTGNYFKLAYFIRVGRIIDVEHTIPV